MAKIGEGDPRWLVEARDDGKNVNNWHWEEKDITQWSKTKLTEALTNLPLSEDGSIKTLGSIEFSGEATANNRKGKTIFYYELDVSVKWEGGDSSSIKGKISLPYISEENSDDGQEVRASVETSDAASEAALAQVRAYGVPEVRARVKNFLAAMREEFSRKQSSLRGSQDQSTPPATRPEPAAAATVATPSSPTVKKVAGVRVINIAEEFRARPADLYETFTNPQRISAFTQAAATFEPQVGGKFSMFNGAVFGEVVDLVPGQRIVQKWRFRDWPEGHFSTVTMEFKPKGDGTSVQLSQTGVPPDDTDRTREGWMNNIFERIKMVFGFGPSKYNMFG